METATGKTPTTTLDETLLIRRILDGQTGLFRQLAERYATQVMRMVGRLIPSPEEAEEVTQDTLLEAFQSLARFDARKASFPTWLMRIAYHTALKHYRQRHKAVAIVEMEPNWLETVADEEADALLDDTNRAALVEKAIDTLKTDDQMLLNLYYFDNRPIREIACITERSEGYLHSRLQWIRKKLTITIKNIENDEEN